MIAVDISNAKFELGRVVGTPGAVEAFERNKDNPGAVLTRHVSGDWGDVCAEDKASNDEAVAATGEDAQRVLSAYSLADKTRIWIITEWDRSVTTILLPEEY